MTYDPSVKPRSGSEVLRDQQEAQATKRNRRAAPSATDNLLKRVERLESTVRTLEEHVNRLVKTSRN